MKIRTKKATRVALADLQKGESGNIVFLAPQGEKDLLKFLILGLIPGEKVTVIHNKPLYVIGVGHTQIALDKEQAAHIYVCVE